MATTAAEQITLTIPQCAAQLGRSPETVIRWIEEGHLQAFVPPGRSLGSGVAGPKGYLVFRADWERFLRSRTMTGTGQVPAASVPTPRPGVAAGTDGVSRRKRGRRG